MSDKRLSRRSLLRLFGVGAAASALTACQPKVVEKIVQATVLVEKEKIIEKEKQVTTIVEKEKAVEKVVTATPMPEEKYKGRVVVAVNGVNAPTWLNAQRKLAEDYRKRRPNVEIVWEGSTGPGFNYPTWLGTMLAADPIYVDLVAGNYQASYRNYLDLRPYMKEINPHSGRPWDEDYDFTLFSASDATGKYYFTCGYVVHCYWFYNKEMFDDAGAKPPTSWPEWIETCTLLKNKGYTPISANFSYMVPQWDLEVYYDQFMRDERHEFGRALEGDWCYNPDVDGKMTYDPKEKFFDRSYTFSAQRWLNNIQKGNFSYNRDEVGMIVKRMGEVFNTTFCTEDLFVMTDSYLPFLQRQTAIMNNGTWSLPTLTRDFEEMTDARREQLKISKEVAIQPFEWATFENPSMIDDLVDGPARAVESASGPYCAIVNKSQEQTELALDFQMYWYSTVGWQVWCDALIEDNAFTPSGPPFAKDIRLPATYTDLFKQITFMGNAEIPWNSLRFGTSAGVGQQTLQLFTDALQGKLTPPAYAEALQKAMIDGFADVLEASNLNNLDVDNPARKPSAA